MAITFGLDLSHHQDLSLNLAQARRDGCEFAFIKAAEGGSLIDDEFAANLAEARAAGMLVAAYVFVRTNASAAAHVALANKVIPRDVPIILDVETAIDKTKPSLAQARAVLDAFRAAGRPPVLSYIPLWYWRDVWGSPALAGWPPLWSSRYPDMVVGTLADEWADVPASYWNGYGGLPVALLQFTSSARIAGYQPLDANAFRGTRDQLAALFGQAGGGGAAPAAAVIPMEETMKDVPAGQNVETRLFAAGRPHYLWIEATAGSKVTVRDLAYIKRTPDNKPDGDYGQLGQPGYPDLRGWVFDADRPGPIQFADDVAWVTLYTDADDAFSVAIG